jgi:hypothetical protein
MLQELKEIMAGFGRNQLRHISKALLLHFPDGAAVLRRSSREAIGWFWGFWGGGGADIEQKGQLEKSVTVS